MRSSVMTRCPHAEHCRYRTTRPRATRRTQLTCSRTPRQSGQVNPFTVGKACPSVGLRLPLAAPRMQPHTGPHSCRGLWRVYLVRLLAANIVDKALIIKIRNHRREPSACAIRVDRITRQITRVTVKELTRLAPLGPLLRRRRFGRRKFSHHRTPASSRFAARRFACISFRLTFCAFGAVAGAPSAVGFATMPATLAATHARTAASR